jgi:hypothetical protein
MQRQGQADCGHSAKDRFRENTGRWLNGKDAPGAVISARFLKRTNARHSRRRRVKGRNIKRNFCSSAKPAFKGECCTPMPGKTARQLNRATSSPARRSLLIGRGWCRQMLNTRDAGGRHSRDLRGVSLSNDAGEQRPPRHDDRNPGARRQRHAAQRIPLGKSRGRKRQHWRR